MDRRLKCLVLSVAILGLAGSLARADEFDRLDGVRIASLLEDSKTTSRTSLNFRDLEALPNVLRDSRSALLLVKTDQGNLARLLAVPAFRKKPTNPSERPGSGAPEPELIPVLLIERFEVLEGTRPSARIAGGRDLMLFDGFRFDLDSGQVVPDGLGGDLKFTAEGRDGGRLATIGSSRMVTPSTPLEIAPSRPGPPDRREGDHPLDFSGRFRFVADGRWKGLLELSRESDGTVSGRFRSDSTGSEHSVTGKLEPDAPRKLRFAIQFPRARQEYQGLLWSEGGDAFSGIGSMLGREFGFVAVRESAGLNLRDPAGVEVKVHDADPKAPTPSHRVLVEAAADRYVVATASRTGQELTEILTAALRRDPETTVVLLASDDVPYSRLRQAIDVIRNAGITRLRLEGQGNRP